MVPSVCDAETPDVSFPIFAVERRVWYAHDALPQDDTPPQEVASVFESGVDR